MVPADGRQQPASGPAPGSVPVRVLEPIDEAECLELIRGGGVGRLAVSTPEGPEIFTVNYAVDDGTIVIWTAPGLKLAHASFHRVAFEVDQLDLVERTGWVVEAKGLAEDITDAIDASSTRLLGVAVDCWVTGPHPNCIAIERIELSGRRLVAKSSG